MVDLLTYLAAAIALTAALGRFRTIRPASPTPAQRHLLVALAAIASSLALVAPGLQRLTARVDPFPYATQLLSSALAMLAAYCVVAMLAHVCAPDTAARLARTHVATLVAAIAGMTVMLLVYDGEFRGEFITPAARDPFLAVHQLVYFVYLATCMTRFIVWMRRWLSRPDARPLMRRGMLVVVAAAVVGLLWLMWNIVTMATAHSGRQVVSNPGAISQVLGASAATLMALGSTLPLWGGWLLGTVHNWRVRRALRHITPLWQLLASMLPEITLRQPDLTHPELLLYRRLIEIRDAQRRLLGHVPPHVDRHVRLGFVRVRQLDKRAIRAEAVALATAIAAHRAGRRQPAEPTRARYPSIDRPNRLAEARWLIQVHTAIRRNRAIARIADPISDRRGPDRRTQRT